MENRSQYFYTEVTLTGSYSGNNFKLSFTSRHVRFAVVGGDLEYSLIGPNDTRVDGKVLNGENLPLDGLETAKISVRGTGIARIWAYK